MKTKRIVSFFVVAAFLFAALTSVLLVSACGGKTENNDAADTAEPAANDSTADPNKTDDVTATPEVGDDPALQTDVPEATPDPDATEDPEATPDGSSGIIENGGDIEIIIPTGQSSGGL